MATLYSATYPASADWRDVFATAVANLPQPPDHGPQLRDPAVQPNTVIVAYDTFTLTAQQIASFQAAVAATTADPNAPFRNQNTIVTAAQNALATNRTYIGLASPTNAQNAAQLKALSQQMNGVIRMLLGDYSANN